MVPAHPFVDELHGRGIVVRENVVHRQPQQGVGLALTTLYDYLNGYIPLTGAVPVWIFQACLTTVFLSAYFLAPNEY